MLTKNRFHTHWFRHWILSWAVVALINLQLIKDTLNGHRFKNFWSQTSQKFVQIFADSVFVIASGQLTRKYIPNSMWTVRFGCYQLCAVACEHNAQNNFMDVVKVMPTHFNSNKMLIACAMFYVRIYSTGWCSACSPHLTCNWRYGNNFTWAKLAKRHQTQ